MRWGVIVFAALATAACNDRGSGAAADSGATLLAARLDAASSAAHDAGSDLDDTALPHTSSEELSARMRHLLEAISQDNADLASDVLFPRDAYAATKDLSDPSKAWERRLQSGFK